jgi:hypothetical protein
MGFKYSYDITNAVREVNACAYDITSPLTDGFVAWGAKQDLYRLKWILEDALRRCPNFSLEEEWLREEEKKKVIRILSSDI